MNQAKLEALHLISNKIKNNLGTCDNKKVIKKHKVDRELYPQKRRSMFTSLILMHIVTCKKLNLRFRCQVFILFVFVN